MLDYRRKFIEAAQRYLEISYRSEVEESERMTSLEHALHCTILASAGKVVDASSNKIIQSVWHAVLDKRMLIMP